MTQLTTFALLFTGVICLLMAGLVFAQDDETATEAPETTETAAAPEFIGSGECRECHRDINTSHRDTAHALTFAEVDEEASGVVADFTVGADARTVTFPDGTARAFELSDVAYTLGVGRNRQAFVYREGDANDSLYVFPVNWDTNTNTWIPLELAESWPDEAYAFSQNCAACHTVGLDVSDYTWLEEGVRCESCHGPGLEHVEIVDAAGGNIDEEERAAIYDSIHVALDSQSCGQCHSRGLATDGIHPYPVGYYPGTNDLAEAFTVVVPGNADFWWTDVHARQPNMQFNEAMLSGHAMAYDDLASSENYKAECLTCHSAAQLGVESRLGNDDIDPATVDPLAVAQQIGVGVTCASCHDPHSVIDGEPVDPMMRPAANLREADNYTLCVSCHSDSDITPGIHFPVQQVFEGQPVIAEVEVEPGVHFTAEGGPTCSTCHMPSITTYNGDRDSHAFQIVAPGDALTLDGLQDSCSGCHDEGPEALQLLIDDIQIDTQARLETARAALSDDTPTWVVNAIEMIEGDGSNGIHNYAYTDDLLDAIEAQLGLSES